MIETAPGLGVDVLSLYAFSSDNWQRPRAEVETLMDLFESHLDRETTRCADNDIRLAVIGRRDRLRPSLVEAIETAEATTRKGRSLLVRMAVDYSSRWAIQRASERTGSHCDPATFETALLDAIHSPQEVGQVDLLIRTGGEARLSDFLLWECAYAEFHFTTCPWPDFGEKELVRAVESYGRRERRFGALPTPHMPRLAESVGG